MAVLRLNCASKHTDYISINSRSTDQLNPLRITVLNLQLASACQSILVSFSALFRFYSPQLLDVLVHAHVANQPRLQLHEAVISP